LWRKAPRSWRGLTGQTVFIIRPTDRRHVRAKAIPDEFGTLSTDSDWVPKEMLKLLLNSHIPTCPNATHLHLRPLLAAGRTFPVVIDMRRLSNCDLIRTSLLIFLYPFTFGKSRNTTGLKASGQACVAASLFSLSRES